MKLMPDVPALFDRARGLAVLSLLNSNDEPPHTADWTAGDYALVRRRSGLKFTYREQAHSIDIHFTDAGVLLLGYRRNSEFRSFEYGEEWQEILEQIPEPLKALPFGLHTTLGFRTGGDGGPNLPFVTCVMWRLPEDGTWHIPRFTHPEDVVDDMLNHAEDMTTDEWRDDGAAYLLEDLLTPILERSFWARGVRGEGMSDPHSDRGWIAAEDVEWTDTGMTEADAVRHVLELRPVTDQVALTLHPTRTVADVLDHILATGYPQYRHRGVTGWYSADTTER
ncbi:hypothetical protein ABZY19_34050 [Streptomyces sp. NPDC006475]|uniref:hypothetical protein n=1 Tax=Streptomyces sp. NPDC006475 TaxID=3155719 RepID=UPI0033B7D622